MSIKPIRFLQILCLLLISNSVYTQQTEQSLKYSGKGIGAGVIACIIAFVVGVLICIFGISSVYPEIFIAIGFCIPIFFFIFFSFCPIQDLESDNLEENNKHWNVFIIWRWLYFSVMLAMLLALFAPLWILWNVTIMPQRVDSRAQKKHDEEYQAFLKEEKRKEELKELQEHQPGNALLDIHSTLQLNNNNNNTMNGNNIKNEEGYLQQPILANASILPLPVSRNENDPKKFTTLKRKTHNQDPMPQ